MSSDSKYHEEKQSRIDDWDHGVSVSSSNSQCLFSVLNIQLLRTIDSMALPVYTITYSSINAFYGYLEKTTMCKTL